MFRSLFSNNHILKISNVVARSGIIRLPLEDSRYIGLLSLASSNVLQLQPGRYYCKKGKDPCPPTPPDPCKEKKAEKKVEPPCDINPTCQKIEQVKTKKVSDKDVNDACKKIEKLKSSKIVLKECKPVDIHPCQVPCPTEKTTSKIPPLDVCAAPDLSSECPKPQIECPEDKDDGGGSKYRTAILLGLLLAAATLAGLYFAGFFDKKEKEPCTKKPKKKKSRRVAVRDPKTSAEIPNEIPYLLIGGGTASFSAFRAIKSAEPTAKVLVITNESFHPYMRPPLSKEMWYNDDKDSVKKLMFKQWNGSERNLYYEPEDFYIKCKDLMTSENGGVAVARGYTVTHLDPVEKIAYLDDGYEIHYDKCLVATGSTPKQLKVFQLALANNPELDEKVKLFRNIYDFEDLYDSFGESKSIAVIGGGFLGSELACALAKKANDKKKVYQIFREPGNMGKILPEYLSKWTTNKVKGEGVEILNGTEVVSVSKNDKHEVVLTLSSGKTIRVDQVVVAVGVEPNTSMAEKSSLEVDPELGGYLVNTELLARSSLYIAGDSACFYDAKLGRRRIEHHDHAVVTGRLAGENMTGQAKPYLHQSMFWSDLGPDVGYEAIGIVDASLPTVGVFTKATEKDTPAEQAKTDETSGGRTGPPPQQSRDGDGQGGDANNTQKRSCNGVGEGDDKNKGDINNKSGDNKNKSGDNKNNKSGDKEDYGKGIVFYLRDDVVVGIVLWNVFNRMPVARQVLKDERKYDDLNEVAKLFNIHEE